MAMGNTLEWWTDNQFSTSEQSWMTDYGSSAKTSYYFQIPNVHCVIFDLFAYLNMVFNFLVQTQFREEVDLES